MAVHQDETFPEMITGTGTESSSIRETKNIESEVPELCNYGDYVWMKGITQGVAQGEVKKLIKIVCNMFSKGTDPAGIADTLGEEPLLVEEICQAATMFAPEYDCEKIYQKLQESKL